MIKPFFLKCHPDVQTTTNAKRINLRALQTLNGLLDIVDAATTATTSSLSHGSSKNNNNNSVVEWPESVHVEFLITVQERRGSNNNNGKSRKNHDIVERTSRRKVELTMPSRTLQSAVRQEQQQQSSLLATRQLHRHFQSEFVKLLKVAGLPVPPPIFHDDGLDDDDYIDDDVMDGAWNKELNFLSQEYYDDESMARERTFASTASSSRFHRSRSRSRQRFVANVDWKRIHRLTQEAVADMEADLATQGAIRNHVQRKQDVITNILSKIRIEGQDDENDNEIDMLEQLIAFRRLSLILHDNFDDLYMEDMGRMWENLVLVLRRPRRYNTSSSALRKRRRRRNSALDDETGYQFSYGSNGVVTIHIPIDFRDEELVAELDRNLWDFHKLVGGDGVEDLYPKWFTQEVQ